MCDEVGLVPSHGCASVDDLSRAAFQIVLVRIMSAVTFSASQALMAIVAAARLKTARTLLLDHS